MIEASSFGINFCSRRPHLHYSPTSGPCRNTIREMLATSARCDQLTRERMYYRIVYEIVCMRYIFYIVIEYVRDMWMKYIYSIAHLHHNHATEILYMIE